MSLSAIEACEPELMEQYRIDELRAQVRSTTTWHAHSLAGMVALIPSILDEAFKGEL